MEFRPVSVTTTNTVAYAALGLILLLFAVALFKGLRRNEEQKA